MQKSFFEKVYEVVSDIPKGKVLTYKDVAVLAGSPGASRAVGMSMKHNPDMKTIPCHRVVASDGAMRGYSAKDGVSSKSKMLNEEGVCFAGRRVDLEKSRWKGVQL